MAKAKEAKNLNLQEAKIEVRKAIGKIAKDAKQDYRNYKYVSHEAVTAAVIPAMHTVGMTHTPTCTSVEVRDGFAFIHMEIAFQMAKTWVHSDDGDIETTSVYAADKIKDGTSMGAIMSYGIKTALLKYFGLESGDPDLEELSTDIPKPKKKAPKEKMEVKDLTGVDPDTETEELVDIFNGVVLADAETMKTFLDLCNEAGLTQEQLDSRLRGDGYEGMDAVPKDIMQDWIERMVTNA